MLNFLSYLVCMWLGVGVGVFAVSLCLCASDRRADIIRRGRTRWWS